MIDKVTSVNKRKPKDKSPSQEKYVSLKKRQKIIGLGLI